MPNAARKVPSNPSWRATEFAGTATRSTGGCPSPKDLKHISELTTTITPSEGDLPHDCPLGNEVFPGEMLRAGHFYVDGFATVP